ncbi:internalin, putative [Labilithrix luteola]|uniref:Internalin, putative n=1 Tax=Labilithrix luteola TaxID=1391654 RepID=A0A0K1PL42_9BACT|nr:SprB repeat-containing protein [Labilithrix luteola]AKU94131.1 internalin, putative [Labilithrix luteola]
MRTALPFVVGLAALCYSPSAFATTVTVSTTSVKCNGGSDGTATASATNGPTPYTYRWSNGQTTAKADGLVAGVYSVEVTDADGVKTTQSGTVTEPTALSSSWGIANVTCNGYSNGVVGVSMKGGVAPYTYVWSPRGGNSPVAVGMPVGSYTVTVKDANLCQHERTLVVKEPLPIVLTSTTTSDASCSDRNDGKASVTASGGTPGFLYSWDGGGWQGGDATNLTAGEHTVSVEDAFGCPASLKVTIGAPPPLTYTVSQTEIACAGGKASATMTASGGTAPYSYGWSTGETSATATELTAAGNYSGTVTDARGCQTSRTVAIAEPPALVATPSSTSVLCHGGSSGTARVDASGGTAPYTYAWSTGETTASLNGLAIGGYSATVKDAKGCTSSANVTVAEPPVLVVSAGTQKDVTCHGDDNGALSVTASGGTGTLKYDWTGNPTGDGTNAVSGLAPGAHSVVVTDGNLCTATKSFTVTEPAVLLANGSSMPLEAVGTCTGSATVAPTGGTLPYSVAWTPGGATTNTADALCGPSAQATITDANQCKVTYDAIVEGPKADVSIELTGPAKVDAGGALSWSFAASTTADAPNVTVNGSVPSRTKFVQLSAPAGWTCTTPAVGAPGTFQCKASSLAASAAAKFTLDVTVDELFGVGKLDATVTVSAAVIDGTAGNNSSTSTVDVRSPAKLVATKSVVYAPPRAVTYTIDVRNDGTSAQVDDPALDELEDVLPAQLTLKTATATTGAATTSGNTVHWNGALKTGETASITIQAEVLTSVAPETTIANLATIHYDQDGNGVNEATIGSVPPGATAPGPTTFVTDKPALPDGGVDGGERDGGEGDGGANTTDGGSNASDGGTNGGPVGDDETTPTGAKGANGGDGASGCSVGLTPSSPRSLSGIGGLVLGVGLAWRRRRSRDARR